MNVLLYLLVCYHPFLDGTGLCRERQAYLMQPAFVVTEGYHVATLVNLLQRLLCRLVDFQFKDIDIGARLPYHIHATPGCPHLRQQVAPHQ